MEKKKKDKVKAAFVGFFKAKSFNSETSKKDVEIIDQEQETYFMPFQVIITRAPMFMHLKLIKYLCIYALRNYQICIKKKKT